MQVTGVDGVKINQPERADAGRGEIHRRRRTQPSRADAEHASRFQLALTVEPDLRHDQMPAVSLHLLAREFGRIDRGARSSRNRGDYADRVAGGERRLFAIEVANVFVVHVDVDETAEAAVLVVKMPSKIAILTDETLQRVADRAAFNLDELLLPGERAKRRRNQNAVGHVKIVPFVHNVGQPSTPEQDL